MTQITYDILLDDDNENVLEMQVTTLCGSKPVDGKKLTKEQMLTTEPHIAFTTVYRFTDLNETEKFSVPPKAAKALR